MFASPRCSGRGTFRSTCVSSARACRWASSAAPSWSNEARDWILRRPELWRRAEDIPGTSTAKSRRDRA